jgi:parallel beta-helix repeat protein
MLKVPLNKKKLILIIFPLILIGIISAYIYASHSSPPPAIVEPGSMVTEADYIIFTDGTNYYARNGNTGKIEFLGTDASTIIQNSINNLPNGGTIFIKNGIYGLSNPLQVKPNIKVKGESWATKLKMNVINKEVVNLIGNGASIENIYVEGYGSGGGDGILITGTENLVEHCYITRARYGIQAYYGSLTESKAIIRNNYAIDNFLGGIYTNQAKDILIIGNYVANKNAQGVYGIAVIGNETSTAEKARIIGNRVDNMYGFGIQLFYFNQATVSDNTISNTKNKEDLATDRSGITVDDSNYNSITGNLIENIEWDGVYIEDGHYNTVSNNTFRNCRYGIQLYHDNDGTKFSTFNTIVGNVIENSRVSGIILNSAQENTIDGNVIRNSVESGIHLYNDTGNPESHHNIIVSNMITKNKNGVRIDSTSNIIVSNILLENSTCILETKTPNEKAHNICE